MNHLSEKMMISKKVQIEDCNITFEDAKNKKEMK